MSSFLYCWILDDHNVWCNAAMPGRWTRRARTTWGLRFPFVLCVELLLELFFFLFAGVWWATSGNPAILREAVECWGVLRCVEGWELPRTITTCARLCSRFLDQLYNQGMDARQPDLTRWLLVFAVQPGFQMWVEYCRAMRSCECIAWSLDRIMIESSFSE